MVWGVPEIMGTFLGIPKTRTITYWGLYLPFRNNNGPKSLKVVQNPIIAHTLGVQVRCRVMSA